MEEEEEEAGGGGGCRRGLRRGDRKTHLIPTILGENGVTDAPVSEAVVLCLTMAGGGLRQLGDVCAACPSPDEDNALRSRQFRQELRG